MLKLKVVSLVIAGIIVSGVSISLLTFNGVTSLRTAEIDVVDYINNSKKLIQKSEDIMKNDITQINLLNNEISNLKDLVADQYVDIYRLQGKLLSVENKLNNINLENITNKYKITSLTNNFNGLEQNLSSVKSQLTDNMNLNFKKTESLTINFKNLFNWNKINITIIINGVKYYVLYGYSGSITINNIPKTKSGINNIKIEIPMFNTITLSTSSTSINVSPVATPITFDGNETLKDAVANAISANPSDLTYYDIASYCYAQNSDFVPKLAIDLSDKNLTTLEGIQELQGFHIYSLNLSHNDINNLAPLKGLTINNLNISNNDITKISSISKINDISKVNATCNYRETIYS